jgi:Acyl-CoA carboxylase epsilon subunit
VVTLAENDSRPEGQPVLCVVRGDASPEEIAALVAVLMTRAVGSVGPEEPPGSSRRSAWSDRSRMLRAPFHPAPGAWRRSALPGT